MSVIIQPWAFSSEIPQTPRKVSSLLRFLRRISDINVNVLRSRSHECLSKQTEPGVYAVTWRGSICKALGRMSVCSASSQNSGGTNFMKWALGFSFWEVQKLTGCCIISHHPWLIALQLSCRLLVRNEAWELLSKQVLISEEYRLSEVQFHDGVFISRPSHFSGACEIWPGRQI
jgi:hypothetical protein